jgi:hypothetical protein
MAKRKPPGKASRVHCDEHGDNVACIICRHLRNGSGLRYYAVRDDPWAWCQECNAFAQRGQGWERLDKFAAWQVYCYQCYRRALRRHKRVAWVQLADEETS